MRLFSWLRRKSDEAPDTLREVPRGERALWEERWRIVDTRLGTIENLCTTICAALCESDGTLKQHLRSHAADAQRPPVHSRLRVVPPTEGDT